MTSADADKTVLRKTLRRQRRAIDPGERARRSALAAGHARSAPVIVAARYVALYAAHGAEADPSAVADHARTCFPLVDGERLAFFHAAASALRAGYRGIREPPATSPARLDARDVIIVPGLGFDRAGRRLGTGGGFYDRFLATLAVRPTLVGFAFDAQIIDRVPTAAHDISMDAVITESGVIVAPQTARFPRGRSV